ncbi:spore cortex biosynthesis protein YabQ [Alicyclobacillus cycloheptanicus]|uniref:Spore cortex biosynthesis protein YabQ n=1 Tax=Alicyclobacillus cycloheptanicus TaxID=1457 RepID=A0ABT9XIL0_9BACL|nr:spore cortex biosynthesis protein YabQ [Alicyclobacillus cycloheptanicus]MDQ0190149.1 spore cortex biosynthesis protein YabQ [Alicyclobacillus cycloheptanicus]WDM02596.1 spore cortex biosynthesis protein YabQ [Alicyclobacillus cycloheptanicus]
MTQIQSVLALVAASWILGAVFDIYNTVTGSSRWLRWLRPALDIAFWVAAAGLVCFVMFTTDDGRLRIYTFLLLAAGYLLYRVWFHVRVVRSAFRVVRAIRAVFLGVSRLVYRVVVWPVLAVLGLAARLLHAVYRVLCWVEDGLFVLLSFWLKVIGFLFRGWAAPSRSMRKKIDDRMEGFWTLASNWIRRVSNRT